VAKLFYIGDHPTLTTGFGTVAYYLTTGLRELGWDVHVFGALAEAGSVPTGLFPFTVEEMPPGMPYGEPVLAETLARCRPDIVLLNNEHRTLGTWSSIAREALGPDVPLLAYRGVAVDTMVEPDLRNFSLVDRNIAYTAWAAGAIRRMSGLNCDVVPHGLNHDVFAPPSADERQRIRTQLGWDEDIFGVLYISRNRPNKKHHRVMRALAGLKREGVDDVRACFHCRPNVTETFKLPGGVEIPGGVNLLAIADTLEVSDLVAFTGDLAEETRGVHQVLGRWRGQRLVKPDLTMAQIYGAADFYLHPSDLETFGLPLVEAMACGTPVAYPDSCEVRKEVCGDAAWRMETVRIKAYPEGWEMNKLTDKSIAGAIRHFRDMRRERPEELEAWRQRGIEWVSRYRWDAASREIDRILRQWVRRG